MKVLRKLSLSSRIRLTLVDESMTLFIVIVHVFAFVGRVVATPAQRAVVVTGGGPDIGPLMAALTTAIVISEKIHMRPLSVEVRLDLRAETRQKLVPTF
jgi:hypothetical protein